MMILIGIHCLHTFTKRCVLHVQQLSNITLSIRIPENYSSVGKVPFSFGFCILVLSPVTTNRLLGASLRWAIGSDDK